MGECEKDSNDSPLLGVTYQGGVKWLCISPSGTVKDIADTLEGVIDSFEKRTGQGWSFHEYNGWRLVRATTEYHINAELIVKR